MERRHSFCSWEWCAGSSPAPGTMATQPESRLQRKIRATLEAVYPQSVWFKYHGGAFTRAGIPDLIGVVDGRFCALEVKRPGEGPSAIQRATIARLKRAGAIVAVVTSPAEATEVVKAALGCWECPGHRNSQGYGRVRFKGKLWRYHRLMWYLQQGPIPSGMDVLHRCHNTACGRLDHLYLGTDAENAADREEAGRGVRLLGEHHGMAKLSAEDVLKIRVRRLAGETLASIAKSYGITASQVSSIEKRRTWKHVP